MIEVPSSLPHCIQAGQDFVRTCLKSGKYSSLLGHESGFPGWHRRWHMALLHYLQGLGEALGICLSRWAREVELSELLSSLATTRLQRGRPNSGFLIGQPYEATPQDGITCSGVSTQVCMAFMAFTAFAAVTSPWKDATNQTRTRGCIFRVVMLRSNVGSDRPTGSVV